VSYGHSASIAEVPIQDLCVKRRLYCRPLQSKFLSFSVKWVFVKFVFLDGIGVGLYVVVGCSCSFYYYIMQKVCCFVCLLNNIAFCFLIFVWWCVLYVAVWCWMCVLSVCIRTAYNSLSGCCLPSYFTFIPTTFILIYSTFLMNVTKLLIHWHFFTDEFSVVSYIELSVER
jgi:hypothetical protein